MRNQENGVSHWKTSQSLFHRRQVDFQWYFILFNDTYKLSVVFIFETVQKPIKPERAQLVSTSLPAATILSSIEPTDEIDQFIARENDRVERVKLRRRQRKPPIANLIQPEKSLPAFSNPNYVEIPILNNTEEKKLSESVLVQSDKVINVFIFLFSILLFVH